MKKIFLCIFLLLITCNIAYADYYNWSVRTDRDGKEAGIFTETPFPVVETDTNFIITNDEGIHNYYLGDVYFLDSNCIDCNNGDTDYNPALRTCGAGSNTVYTTMANALSAVAAGNKTIFVRDGVYSGSNFALKLGIDDSHRFMIIGYNQERPIVDGGDSSYSIFKMQDPNNTADAYASLQRLKLQNNYMRGLFVGDFEGGENTNGYVNVIDVHFYHTGMDPDRPDNNGPCHFNNSHNAWIYHCTIERSYGHCVKIADDTDDTIVEWSVVSECGYWDGIEKTEFWGPHAVGLDLANSIGYSDSCTFRYNIVHDTLFQGIQLRQSENFSIHHNEIYNTQKCYSIMEDDANHCEARESGNWQLNVRGYTLGLCSGYIYSNVFHDPELSYADSMLDDKYNSHIGILTCDTNSPDLTIYNNIFSDHGKGSAISILDNQPDLNTKIYHNSCYCNHANPRETIIRNNNNAGTTTITNNVLYQDGNGSCLGGTTAATHTYNEYYFPNGSRGVELSTGEFDADPGWVQVPSGSYDPNDADITVDSNTIDVGTNIALVNYDINGTPRPQNSISDIGVFEYIADSNTPEFTTITFTIGSDKNYPSLATWYSANSDTNLVSINQSWIIKCYASISTACSLTIQNYANGGFGTDPNHKIIFTMAEEDRHPGYWDSFKGYLLGSGTATILNYCPYVTFEWLQIRNTEAFGYGLYIAASDCIVRNCILDGDDIGYIGLIATDANCVFSRNIIYDYTANGIYYNTNAKALFTYCNTIYGCTTGINAAVANLVMSINNACFDNSSYDYYGTFASGSGYNADSDGTAPGDNSHDNLTASTQFKDPANGDFRLIHTSTIVDNGYNLGTDYEDDAEGVKVRGPWSIGAIQYKASQMIGVSF